MEGWFKIPRELISWRWYNEEGMLRMLLYLIERAHLKDEFVGNIPVKRGQVITSLYRLSDRLDLSVKRVRTSLARLQSDGMIIVKGAQRHTLVTICNFDNYVSYFATKGQTKGKQKANEGQVKDTPTANQRQTDGKPTANQRQTDGKPTASEGQQYKKDNNNIDVGVNARARAYACEGEKKEEVFKEVDENSASPTNTGAAAPVKYLKVESVAEYLRQQSDLWQEQTKMTLGLPPSADLNRYIDMFAAELVAQGVTEKKKDEICRHFVNMMRIKIANEPKQQQNGAKREDGYKFGLQDVAGIVQAGMSLGAQDARKRSGEE
jgi:hypothetical protein